VTETKNVTKKKAKTDETTIPIQFSNFTTWLASPWSGGVHDSSARINGIR
jgi:hypothetical protein